MIKSDQPALSQLSPVCISERRSALTMGLVWITMVTGFPTVLIGFEWFRQGFSLQQVGICTVLSCLLLLVYSIPASQLGARTGLGYCGLSRSVFGRFGTWLVTANLIWIFLAWYGLTAEWMAMAAKDLLHWNFPLIWMSVAFAYIMAFNNFFGFSGIANFARYFAAPSMIVWVLCTFCKAATDTSWTATAQTSHPSTMYALTVISSFIIGFAVWGDEPDYWRFSKPGTVKALLPLAIALILGEIIFPIAGWLVAARTGVTDAAAATALIPHYPFGGSSLLGLIILTATYFAVNDSGLFGLSVAVESTWSLKHRTAIGILSTLGALAAALFSVIGGVRAMEVLTALNCVFAPTPTVIVLTEWLLTQKFFRIPARFSPVPAFSEMPFIRWPAIIALMAGLSVGVATCGLIPSAQILHVGICPVQSWLTASLVYGLLRWRELKRDQEDRQLISQPQSELVGSAPNTGRN